MLDEPIKLILPPNCKNFYPNCVSLKLHVEVGQVGTERVLQSENFLISLSIVFGGEQEIKFPGVSKVGFLKGRLTFGLRKGQLKLSLDGCQLPLEKVHLEKPLKISLEQDIEQEVSGETEIGVSIIPASKPNGNGQIGIKGSRKRVEKFRVEVFQVRKVGSEEMPAWIFEASPSESTLQGSLKRETLGEFILLSADSRMKCIT
jgi:hypothetical protein